jgi:hypothetical protein
VTVLDRNSGTFNTATSISVTRSSGNFGTGTTIVVMVLGNTIITSGTMTARGSSVVDLGIYVWDKTGAGESSISLSGSPAGSGEWFCWELSAGSTFDVVSATQSAVSAPNFTTGTITPASGARHLLAVAGGVGSGAARTVDSFDSSFAITLTSAQVTAQDWPFAAGAELDVTANGSTGYSTTAAFSGFSLNARGGIIGAWSTGGGSTLNGAGNSTVTATRTGAASVDHVIDGTSTVTATTTGAATVAPGGQGTATTSAAITGAATVTAVAAGNLAVSAVATGTPEPDVAITPSVTNNWGSLLSIYRQNAADVQRFLTTPLTQCPYHAYPLEPGRTPGTTHCKFGGEIFDLYGNRVLIS